MEELIFIKSNGFSEIGTSLENLAGFQVEIPDFGTGFLTKFNFIDDLMALQMNEEEREYFLEDYTADVDPNFIENVWLRDLTWHSMTPKEEWIREYTVSVNYFWEQLNKHFERLCVSQNPTEEISLWIKEAEKLLYTECLLSEIKAYKLINPVTKKAFPVDWERIKASI